MLRNDVNGEFIVDVLPTQDGSTDSNGSIGTPTGGGLNAVINQAFGRLLGNSSPTTVADFKAALKNSFVAKKQGDRTTYEWQPYSYTSANNVGGGVTGAQASLYYRAKAILADVLRLLDGLKPLEPAPDIENSAAIRAIVRSEIAELVDEIGLPGGPRVQRVDHYFQRLLGVFRDDDFSGNNGGTGDLATLVEFLGLAPDRINTVEEEENYSNFLILRDYLVSLRVSWENYKAPLVGTVYLGPQLIDLSRALATVSESVRETYRLMNRYFLGPEERRSVVLDFTNAKVSDNDSGFIDRQFVLPNGETYAFDEQGNNTSAPPYAPNLNGSMTVAELLDWVSEFATQEGPMLIRSGGKIGIAAAFEEKSYVLMVLVAAAAAIEPKPNSAFRREAVVRSLQDLGTQLYYVMDLAREIVPPSTGEPVSGAIAAGEVPDGTQPGVVIPQ